MKKYFIILLAVVTFTTSSYSQTPSMADEVKSPVSTGKFDRKSVTIVPLTINSYSNYYNDMVSASMMMPWQGRFDYNYIPKELLNNAQSAFSSVSLNLVNYDDAKNIKSIENIIRNTKILDKIIQCSGNIDSLSARIERSKKRIVTSSTETMKITQPSVEEMMLLMNGTFIGIPVLVSADITNNIGHANGQIYWFRVDLSNVKNWDAKTFLPSSMDEIELIPYFKKAEALTVTKTVSGSMDKMFSQDDGESSAETSLQLDVRASRNLVRQSVLDILNKDEFKVRGTIQDVTDGIRVDIGKREGVYMDQGYKVYELRLNEDNKLVSEEVGFSRIDDVADNTVKYDALSNIYPIIGSYEQGYTITSHDQLFDVSIHPSYKTISIPKEFSRIVGPDLFTEDATASYNVGISALYNTARFTNINQLFLGGSFLIGYPNFKQKTVSGYSAGIPLIMEFNGLVLKKFWFMRFALTIQAEAGLSRISFTGTSGSTDYTVSANSLAFGGTVGLQYAVSADLNLGVEIGYRHALAPTTISYKLGNNSEVSYLKDDSPILWRNAKIDDVKLGGLKIGLTINYSISM